MRLHEPLMILTACVAGYLGATASSQMQLDRSRHDTIRAGKFELVDPSGTVLAVLEPAHTGGVHLKFHRGSGSGVEIGLTADGRPNLCFRGKDQGRRIVMELDEADKPMLGMSDERWEGRVHLGFVAPDVRPDPYWDQWALLFRAFGSERPVATIGTMRTAKAPAEPVLRIGRKSIR